MTSKRETSAIAGAFGSIIGYLGAEVAEPSIFERLLWPQRFYNHATVTTVLQTLLMPSMGGPLHKAALETLDTFRRKGLYGGLQQGHMLDTAFYANKKLHYKLHDYNGIDHDAEVRNGLWVTILQRIRHFQPKPLLVANDKMDNSGELGKRNTVPRRTWQRVQHLRIEKDDRQGSADGNRAAFSEGSIGVGTVILITASEVSAIVSAILVVHFEHCYWFAAYLSVPLILKLVAAFCSVRREGLKLGSGDSQLVRPSAMLLAEVSDYDHGFPLVQGPEDLVRQFFKHYGHPIRESYRDRCREVVGMALVLAFVFVFPIGLLSVMWTSTRIQFVWLTYQMYSVVAMHATRLFGYDGPGRLEDQMARQLAAKDSTIYFEDRSGNAIKASLQSHVVGSIAEGRGKVNELSTSYGKY